MKTTSYAPTHEFQSTCPYCGRPATVQVNLKNDTTDGGNVDVCIHYEGYSVSGSGKFLTFQDKFKQYPNKAVYVYQRATTRKL